MKAMAMAIFDFFPFLRSEEKGSTSYFSFYHPTVGGFIDSRLKTVRLKLPPEQRKRKASKEKDSQGKKRTIYQPGFPRDKFTAIATGSHSDAFQY